MDNQGRSYLDRLLEILNEDYQSAVIRENTAFDQSFSSSTSVIILFGAGNLGRKILQKLRQYGEKKFYFSDNNQKIWGAQIDDTLVLSPEEAAKKFGKDALFINTIWNPYSSHQFVNTQRQLFDLGCKNVIHFFSIFWKYPVDFLPDCYIDLPSKLINNKDQLLNTYSLWSDTESQRTYVTQLEWRILENFTGLPAKSNEIQYFPDLFRLIPDEVFVDCGAYNGDSIDQFIAQSDDKYEKIFAFEPDPDNFNKLDELFHNQTDKIILHQKGVGEKNEMLQFSASGTASSKINNNGNLSIETVKLDDILLDEAPTFIKMDIEGAELSALLGSKKIITKYHPILAICIYHKQDHIWEIPNLITSFYDRYHFYMRAHQNEGWDVVCYAIPENRLKR